MKSRGADMPMVVAGNKTDVEGALEREQTEALVMKRTNKQTNNKTENQQTNKGKLFFIYSVKIFSMQNWDVFQDDLTWL